jgi:hypothetical protein
VVTRSTRRCGTGRAGRGLRFRRRALTWRAAAGTGCDWLLSVANLSVIPAGVLSLAREGRGELSRRAAAAPCGAERAGLGDSAGEAEHGITWHLIEGGVDEGRVLEERRFAIEPDDTALTLNTRCFEAGMESFPAVVAQLEAGPRPRAQGAGVRHLHRGPTGRRGSGGSTGRRAPGRWRGWCGRWTMADTGTR